MGEQNDRRCPSEEEREYYKLYRDRIDHEDLLISHRASWLVALEGALFAVWATSFFREHAIGLLGTLTLAVLGVALAAVAAPSIGAAFRAIEELQKQYESNRPEPTPGTVLPPLVSTRRTHHSGQLLPRWLPRIIIVAWGVAVAIGIMRSAVPGLIGS